MPRILFVFAFFLTLGPAMAQTDSPHNKKDNGHDQIKNLQVNPLLNWQSGLVFIPFNQTIPTQVLKVKEDSLVVIRAGVPHYTSDQGIHLDFSYGVGLVVTKDRILTCLHIFSDSPSVWKDENLVITVFDGENKFLGELVASDSDADLALVKISQSFNLRIQFSKKPVDLASSTFVKDKTGASNKVLYDKFYAFYFFPPNPNVFFPIQIGPMYAITNAMNPVPMGIVQGIVEHGFSGGPLIAPDGKVMGIISRKTEAYTHVVLIEEMRNFLQSLDIK